MLRAKFKCQSVKVDGKNNKSQIHYQGDSLTPIPMGDRFSEEAVLFPLLGDENKPWSELTPAGQLSMKVTNAACFGFYKPGKNYTLDISEDEAEQA